MVSSPWNGSKIYCSLPLKALAVTSVTVVI